MADGIALEGMRLIKKSLSEVVKNGRNLNARLDMLVASTMGSTAFQKGLGAIHSLSHPVNAQFNVHHGLSNAIFMPYVLTFNKDEISNKIISICDYIGIEKSFENFIKEKLSSFFSFLGNLTYGTYLWHVPLQISLIILIKKSGINFSIINCSLFLNFFLKFFSSLKKTNKSLSDFIIFKP